MRNKLRNLSFTFNILLGSFAFIFGEIDDSPGGQLIGLIAVVVGISGLISNKKSEKKK